MDSEDREVTAPYFTGRNKALKLTEVLEILDNPDDKRAIVTTPAQPHGGDGYLYRVEADSVEDSWKNDSYHFKHIGSQEQPNPAPKVVKQYFVAYKSDGSTTKSFKRQAYNLLGADVKYMLVHYIGKHTEALSDPKYEKRLNAALPLGSEVVNPGVRKAGSGDEDGGERETSDMECDHDPANTNSPTSQPSSGEVSSKKRKHDPDIVNMCVKTPKCSESEQITENNSIDNITTECVSHQPDERPTNLRSFTESVLNKRTHIVIARCVLNLTQYWEKNTTYTSLDSPCLSLIADINSQWRNDLAEVSDRLKWSRLSPDILGDDQCPETYLSLISAVIVGAYHMKTDITEFVDTLYMYPQHVMSDYAETDDDDGTDPQMCKVGPHSIQRNHLLDPTAWLGDEVMQAYMHVLQTTWNRSSSHHCIVLDSFLVSDWEKDEYDGPPCKEELGTYTWIVMPVNMPLNKHWVLLVANAQDGTVGVVNSKCALNVEDKLIQHWRKYTCSLRRADGSVVTWITTEYPVLSQTDEHSCGIFVNMALEAVLSEVPPSVMRSCHTVWYRRYIWRRLREYADEHTQPDMDTDMLESPCEKLTNNPASTKARTFAYTIVNRSTSIDDTRYSLHKAASLGDIRRMHLLIDQGEFVASTDDRGWTPLHCACENGHGEAVAVLVSRRKGDVQKRAKLTLYSPIMDTKYAYLAGILPLHIACLNGHENVAHILIKSGANVDDKSETGTTALFFASGNGHKSAVEFLIKSGASVTAVNKDGWTALHQACQNGHESVATLLIKSGASVTAEDKDGCTVLHIACQNGHGSLAALLVKSGASVTAEDKEGCTVLHIACQNGHGTLAALLVKYGASVTAVNKDGSSALHLACKNGHESVATLLIKSGASVTAVDKDRWMALHLACQNGHESVATLLIKSGASVTAVDKDGWTALHLACQNGHESVAALMIKSGASVTAVNKDGLTALHPVCENGNESVATLLIKSGASVTAVDKDGWTALHLACQNGHESVATLLIKSGANVTAVNKKGSALLLACQNGLDSVATLLIKSGANVTAVDKDGWTALHPVCQNGHESVAALLIKSGASVTAVDKDGWTALHLACQNGHESVAALLIKSGANVTAVNKKGSALHLACQNGHESEAALLIKSGSSVTAVDKDGWTALHLASLNGHKSVAALLIKSGANVTAEDKKESTPLHLACRKGHASVAALLIKSGANVYSRNKDRLTALHEACINGHESAISLMIKSGGSVKIR
ncbi:ankyrin-3-like isoform X2 [Haliotis rufescens]|uniref:ankyrin-3-like isoform X2 n=1 Tax=Haliotis rufescens TaxID=6454 RepID=UPI00201F4DB9|nr:ankyrin-3-like isoform X2 [Haliotis rufescens]